MMSPGSRSGVNCTRRNESPRSRASALISSVLPNPGRPSSSRCPRARTEIATSSSSSLCPRMARPSSARTRSIRSLACSVSAWLRTRPGAVRDVAASRVLADGAAAIAAHPSASRSLKSRLLVWSSILRRVEIPSHSVAVARIELAVPGRLAGGSLVGAAIRTRPHFTGLFDWRRFLDGDDFVFGLIEHSLRKHDFLELRSLLIRLVTPGQLGVAPTAGHAAAHRAVAVGVALPLTILVFIAVALTAASRALLPEFRQLPVFVVEEFPQLVQQFLSFGFIFGQLELSVLHKTLQLIL